MFKPIHKLGTLSLPQKWFGLLSGLPADRRERFSGIISPTPKLNASLPRRKFHSSTLAGQAAIALKALAYLRSTHRSRPAARTIAPAVRCQETDRGTTTELHDEIGQILTGLKLTLDMNGRLPTKEKARALPKPKH
jgi:hypothetical protein